MKNSISFQSSLNNISFVENFVDSLSTVYNISEELYGNILISTIEAVNNAIIHGNKQDPSKIVFVSSKIDNDELTISVKDEGLGFDYSVLPDPTLPENIEKISGRGVFLIKNFSDRIEFSEGGSKIEIVFKLSQND